MTYAEVMRLRRLRDGALRVRALAAVLDAREEPAYPLFACAGASCWRLARLISGTLRGHPFLPYQRGQGIAGRASTYIVVRLMAFMARRKHRSLEVFSNELRRVSRELDDARALTRTTQLSESFGRSQLQFHRLMQELEIDLIVADGVVADDGLIAGHIGAVGRDTLQNWPYLAL